MTHQNPRAFVLPALHQEFNFVNRLFQTLATWQAMHRERRDLLALDDHLLMDIGFSRTDALREASRPFWDVPVARRGKQMDGAQSKHAGPTILYRPT